MHVPITIAKTVTVPDCLHVPLKTTCKILYARSERYVYRLARAMKSTVACEGGTEVCSNTNTTGTSSHVWVLEDGAQVRRRRELLVDRRRQRQGFRAEVHLE